MPDRDVFPGLHRSWRGVARAVCGAHPPEAIGSLAEKALAHQLRLDPAGRGKLNEAASAIAQSGDVRALRDVASDADLKESLLLRKLGVVARASATLDEHDLVEDTLVSVTRDQLDTLRPRLVAETFRDAADATRYLDECVGGVRTQLLADQVVRGSDRIRAPRRERKSTLDLLYQPLT